MSRFEDILADFRQPIETSLADTASDVAVVQQSTDTLSSYFNTPRSVPSWMGDQADDVAFDVDKIDGTSSPTLGQVVLIPVKVVQDRVYDAVKFGIAAAAMTNCYVGLYATDLSSGDLTKVVDLGDCKSQLNTSYNQQTVDLPDLISVQRGEVYYIGVLQVGGTVAAMHRSSSSTNFTTGLFPRYRGNVYATGSQTALPSSIAVANVNSGTRYWGALGTAADPVTPGAIFVSDSFNRANGSLGAAWTNRSGSPQIISNQPWAGVGATSHIAAYNTRLTSASQRVGCRLVAAASGQIFLRGNGLGPRVGLNFFVGGGVDKCQIVTLAGTYTGNISTTRIVGTPAGSHAGLWTFEAIGSVYTAYKDGLSVCTWTDSGGAFTYGSSNTEVGIGPLQTSGGSATTLDDWFAQDL